MNSTFFLKFKIQSDRNISLNKVIKKSLWNLQNLKFKSNAKTEIPIFDGIKRTSFSLL